MDVGKKIRIASEIQGVHLSRIAEAMGTTRQSFNDRLNTGKFTEEELKRIGKLINAEWRGYFILPDGTIIE